VLIDFNIGMGVVIKADKAWRGMRQPQLAMHSQLPHFLVFNITSSHRLQEDTVAPSFLCAEINISMHITNHKLNYLARLRLELWLMLYGQFQCALC